MVYKCNYLLCSLVFAVIITSHRVRCAVNDDIIDDEDRENELIASNQSQDFNFDDKKADNGKTLSRDLKQMYNWWSIEDICKDVKCKLNEYCVIKSKEVAVCVKRPKYFSTRNSFEAKKKLLKTNNLLNKNNLINNDDEEDDDDYDDDTAVEQKSVYTKSDDSHLKLCTPCPVVKPLFICGSDNSTYSSICRLDFHNCVHKTRVEYVCNGFCPCFKKLSADLNGFNKKNRFDKTRNSINKHLSKLKQEKNSRVFDKYDKQEKFFIKNNKNYKLNSKKLENNQYMHNIVLQNKKKLAKTNEKCTPEDLKVMGTRLLDWFSVVIAEQQKKDRVESKKNSASRIPDCHKDVSYMFHHFDTNSDLKLSIKELYYLEHDENEHCLQPYLTQCDEDNDKFLSAYEWCTCFDTKSSPCTAALQHLKKGILGAYMPQCDSDGFYKPTQCHASTGICWCVDKNGVEFLNSRRKGVPDCKALLNNARERSKLNEIDNDDEDDDDDDLDDGSGDDRSNQ